MEDRKSGKVIIGVLVSVGVLWMKARRACGDMCGGVRVCGGRECG
jgi:hypothetical protein